MSLNIVKHLEPADDVSENLKGGSDGQYHIKTFNRSQHFTLQNPPRIKSDKKKVASRRGGPQKNTGGQLTMCIGLCQPNTTQIPNKVFDCWVEALTPAEFKVMLAIYHLSKGYSFSPQAATTIWRFRHMDNPRSPNQTVEIATPIPYTKTEGGSK